MLRALFFVHSINKNVKRLGDWIYIYAANFVCAFYLYKVVLFLFSFFFVGSGRSGINVTSMTIFSVVHFALSLHSDTITVRVSHGHKCSHSILLFLFFFWGGVCY